MSRRILLADDSVTIQKVIELTFMDGDFEVRAVSSGDEAIAVLDSADPDVVIADVHMPGANGYEVARRSKALRPHVPVLLLVGTFEPFDEAQARACGADRYLKKPFDSQELLEIVEQLASSGTAPAAADFAPAPPAPLPFPVFPGAAAQTTPASPVAPEAPAASAPVFPETSFVFSEPFPEAASAEPPARAAEPIWSNFEIEPDAVTLPPLDESDLGLRVEPEAMFELAPEADEPLPVFSPFESAPEPAPSDAAPPVPEATPAPAAAPPATPEPAFPSFGEMDFPAEPIAAPEPPRFAAGFAPAPPPPAAAPVAAAPAAPAPSGSVTLSDDDVDRIARRVVELLGDKPVRDVAWEVIPDLAEVVIRDRIRELEAAAEA